MQTAVLKPDPQNPAPETRPPKSDTRNLNAETPDFQRKLNEVNISLGNERPHSVDYSLISFIFEVASKWSDSIPVRLLKHLDDLFVPVLVELSGLAAAHAIYDLIKVLLIDLCVEVELGKAADLCDDAFVADGASLLGVYVGREDQDGAGLNARLFQLLFKFLYHLLLGWQLARQLLILLLQLVDHVPHRRALLTGRVRVRWRSVPYPRSP